MKCFGSVNLFALTICNWSQGNSGSSHASAVLFALHTFRMCFTSEVPTLNSEEIQTLELADRSPKPLQLSHHVGISDLQYNAGYNSSVFQIHSLWWRKRRFQDINATSDSGLAPKAAKRIQFNPSVQTWPLEIYHVLESKAVWRCAFYENNRAVIEDLFHYDE